MIKLLRSLSTSLCLGLITLTLAIAIPVIAQPSIPEQMVKVSNKSLNLIEQGRIAYEAGRYTEAIKAWQEGEQIYQQQGDRALQVSSLNYLSLAYQKLGKWEEAKKSNALSLELLQQRSRRSSSPLSDEYLPFLGQALNSKGSLELATGQSQSALETWQQATATYEKAGDEIGVIGSQINQAQALQTLGLHRRSQKLLEQTQQQLNEQSDPFLKTKLLRSLGTTLQTIGDLHQSQKVLEASLAIAQKFNLPEEQAATLFSLGNTTKLQGNYQTAIAFYQQAADLSIQPITKVEAQLNLLSSLIITKQQETAETILPKIKSNLAKLSLSRPTIYAKVNLAKNLIDLQAKNSNATKYTAEIESLLQE
ncbi:MAG: tetratricopeptide repeat protein, partial [Waterburya sp.]